jgi:predicted ATPase
MTNAKNRVTSFGLRNFKAFHYLEDIELKPLTVLVGANSTGKSSIFQSLLLLKQTSEASRFGGALKFDGDWTRLGSFGTAISDFDKSKVLEYRFNVEFDISSTDLLILLQPNERSLVVDTNRIRGSSDIVIEFGAPKPEEPPALLSFRIQTELFPREGKSHRSELLIDSNQTPRAKNLYLPGGEVFPQTAILDKFWPEALNVKIDTSSLSKSMGDMFRSTKKLTMDFFSTFDEPLKTLRKDLEVRLEYLGPLRADPRPFYPIDDDPDIGLRGEGVIPYLLHHQHDTVGYLAGPSEDLQQAALLEAINAWLERMNVTSRLTIDPLEAIAYTAAIQSRSVPGKSVNLAQVGFGISQILPVLVAGLKNPSDAWLLLEQPEIHLHPRLQGELGDFLLCAAKAGKTIMVETHSDHLVNRIRRRIAEDETGTLASMVQILFVHAGTEDNPSSYVEPLQVDESGTILNCPPDFFSEAPDEAFAILQAQRRKTKKAAP